MVIRQVTLVNNLIRFTHIFGPACSSFVAFKYIDSILESVLIDYNLTINSFLSKVSVSAFTILILQIG